jgi:hypothetical protein
LISGAAGGIKLCLDCGLDDEGLRREKVHAKLTDFDFGGYFFEESGGRYKTGSCSRSAKEAFEGD